MSCDLTVIVAQIDPSASLRGAIAALERACADVPAEIVVAQAEECPGYPAMPSRTPLSTIRVGGGALVPQLWAQGIGIAQGEYVAFSLGNCEVSEGWAREMIGALRAGAAGVAGPLECSPDAGVVDRAVYYLRYSSFIPSRVTDADVTGEIPGDNAAYRREILQRHRDLLAEGFWEVLFHQRLRRDGGRLCTRRAARASFCGGISLRRAVHHRFAHGRHFGAWRVAEGQRTWWQICATAPVVPLILANRAASCVMGSAADRWAFVTALPLFLAVASAWALGEAVGALCGAALPRVRVADSDFFDSGQASGTSAASVH